MKPPPFEYVAATSVTHALSVKAERGSGARFLAGGQSLIPEMNFRLAHPDTLIDINALTDLDFVRRSEDGEVRIGALARHARMLQDPLVRTHVPLLHEAAPHVAHPQVRNRGTVCGNLAHADPASEFPAVMLALNARLRALSSRGERWITVDEFFLGVFSTALEEDEMLLEIALPRPAPGTGTAFAEVARRRGDYAMMGVAATVTRNAQGICTAARITLCNAGPTPVLARQAAAILVGSRGPEAIDKAAAAVDTDIDPPGTVHTTKRYQRHLARVLTSRVLATAISRAVPA